MNDTIVMNCGHATLSLFELTVIRGKEKGKKYQLMYGRQSYGRSPENTVVIDDQTVSRKHGVIDCTGDGRVIIYDLASRNGISLDGKSQPVVEIREGQTVQVGSTYLKLAKMDEKKEETKLPENKIIKKIEPKAPKWKKPFATSTATLGALILLSMVITGGSNTGTQNAYIQNADVQQEINQAEKAAPAPVQPARRVEKAPPKSTMASVAIDELEERAEAAFSSRNYKEAFSLWHQALGINPASARANEGIQRLEQVCGKLFEEAMMTKSVSKDQAEEMLKTIMAITNPDSPTHKKAGELLTRWG